MLIANKREENKRLILLIKKGKISLSGAKSVL